MLDEKIITKEMIEKAWDSGMKNSHKLCKINKRSKMRNSYERIKLRARKLAQT